MKPELMAARLNLRIAKVMLEQDERSPLMLLNLVSALEDYIRMREAEETPQVSND